MDNDRLQTLPEAGERTERRLEAIACKPWLAAPIQLLFPYSHHFLFVSNIIGLSLSNIVDPVVFVTIGRLKFRNKYRQSVEIRELIGVPCEDLVI